MSAGLVSSSSAPAMRSRDFSFEASPQLYARSAGLIYLAVIVFGGFSEGVVMNSLVAPGDMAATARHIAASHDLWRISAAGNLAVPILAVVQLWIEYLLLRPAGRAAALLFVLMNAASLAVEAVSKIFLLLVEPALNGSGGLADGSQKLGFALARFALQAHDIAFNITLLLFGCACLVSGYLIRRSRFLPRLVGWLMQMAGACYLVASWAALFAPGFASQITPWILLPPLIGESSLCLWLLIRGVDVTKWREAIAAS